MAIKGYEQVAQVQFIEGTNKTKVYNFALYDHAVGVGEYALVKSSNCYGNDFGVVKVIAIESASEHTGAAPTAEIICKVDMGSYECRVQARKTRDALKKKMDKLVKDSQEILVYQTVAANNEEMAALLAEYLGAPNV